MESEYHLPAIQFGFLPAPRPSLAAPEERPPVLFFPVRGGVVQKSGGASHAALPVPYCVIRAGAPQQYQCCRQPATVRQPLHTWLCCTMTASLSHAARERGADVRQQQQIVPPGCTEFRFQQIHQFADQWMPAVTARLAESPFHGRSQG